MEQKKKTEAVVISQKCITNRGGAEGIYDMRIETDLAKQARPGQFIMIYPKDKSTLLPRPISICEADRENNWLRIVYRVAGKGTGEFSAYQEGNKIQIMGTLGNGFPLEKAKGKKAFLIGGGIGIPPLLQLAKELDADKEILLGYRDAKLFLAEELGRYGRVYAATEDGSAGTKGNVMDIVAQNHLKADIIYACGPMPMLWAVKAYAEKEGIEAYISLEERMACGVGACLGCVCKTKEKDHHSHVNNARVCTEGPVFEAKDIG